MADKRNRSHHRVPDRPDLPWPIWAEKYAPPTANSSTDQLPKHVNDNVLRICRQDADLYGRCPRQDECCLVVCNQCRQLIRIQALYGHYERRHLHCLTNSRHQHSTAHKDAHRNASTNGPHAPSQNSRICERRDSSSDSSDRVRSNAKETSGSSDRVHSNAKETSGSSDRVHSNAKETKVSSSRRKPSLSSQPDSDDSASGSRTESHSDSVGKYVGSYSKDHRRHGSGSNDVVTRRRTADVCDGVSETSVSLSKNSVKVNGVKVVGSSDLPQSVGVQSSHPSATTVSLRKSSKHANVSSQAASETFSVENSSKSQTAKSESNRMSSAVASKTKERYCDSGYKSYLDNSQASSRPCRTKNASAHTKDDLSSVSFSSESSRATPKGSKSRESSATRLDSSHGKSVQSAVETKPHSNHRVSATVSVSVPAASRHGSSAEDCHRTSSAAVAPSPRLSRDNSRVGTATSDTRFSSRSAVDQDSVFNFSDVSSNEPLKPIPDSLDEQPSRSASKMAPHLSSSSRDLPRHASLSKSSHRSTSRSNSVTKSASLNSPDFSKSKWNSRTEPKISFQQSPDDSFSVEPFAVEPRGVEPCSVEPRGFPTSSRKECPSDIGSMVVAHPTIEIESPGSAAPNCLSKKVPKCLDKPKSSSQFCKDREFDPDKHCGVVCADTGKQCTHSLTCKIHALSLRRSVPGRTKPFDQILSEHRLVKETLRKKHEQQQHKSKSLSETTMTPVQVTLSSSPSSDAKTQGAILPPVSESSPVSCQQPSGNQFSVRPPWPWPKPRFRTSLFRSSSWFSVLTPAAGFREKQIARPVKLPLFHANGTIKLPDDTAPSTNGDADNMETPLGFNSHQNSSFCLHHPKPVAINRFGAWRVGHGCNVFSRKEDLSRSTFEEMLDFHLHPPPHKKLCMDSSLRAEVSVSHEPPSSRDPFRFATGAAPSTHVSLPFPSSPSLSSAFPRPARRHSSRSKTRSSPLSIASPAATAFRSPGLNLAARDPEYSSAVHHDTSNTNARSSSQHDLPPIHRQSLSADVVSSAGAIAVGSNSPHCKIMPADRSGNILSSPIPDPHPQNGKHQLTGSGKKRSQNYEDEEKWYTSDSAKGRTQRTSEGQRCTADDSKTGSIVKGNGTRFKDSTFRVTDGCGGRQASSCETARPSVIAFGSPALQKFAEISSYPKSSLANLNGLQPNYRSLSDLNNHKPQHDSKDRRLSSQGALSSSAAGLKNRAQVNRTTLEVPTM